MKRYRSGNTFDYALVGGGLQNGLAALALMGLQPEARFALIERRAHLGGNHLWSFHAGDLTPTMERVIEPLVSHRWPAYRVGFPGLDRRIDYSYSSISSDRFNDAIVERIAGHPSAELFTEATARSVEPSRVVLADGSELNARVVVDARGPSAFRSPSKTAYQKFVGLELDVERSMTGELPVIMDARVPQSDGYRFFYVLPLDAHRVLVEDTYFSDSPKLDVPRLRLGIVDYANRRGLGVRSVIRQERGVLPLPSRMPKPAPARSPYVGGYGGGWFHPTTGYSLPAAARVAELIATEPSESLGAAWERLSLAHRRQARFGALLNKLLYEAFAPEDRWNVLERFYRLPEPTIVRFYAGTTTATDRLRILCGRPPRGMSLRFAIDRSQSLTTGIAA